MVKLKSYRRDIAGFITKHRVDIDMAMKDLELPIEHKE